MNYAQIRDMDIVNGEGIAVSLFVQGCTHHCNGCFNQSTWNFEGGNRWTKDIEDEFIALCKRDYITCVSILGGEPFDSFPKSLEMIFTDGSVGLHTLLYRLITEVKKPIYVWTGYTLEEINNSVNKWYWLRYIDYLIDGKFEEDKKDVRLRLRGSSNQRIWDLRDDTPINVTAEKGWRK